jgi:biopolymer transport protein TolR
MEIGQRENHQRRTVLAQINVTPFVDVMLVLLIIFMVTAPMMEKGVDVTLPKVASAPNLTATKEPLVVTVTSDGMVLIGKQRIDADQLGPVLKQIVAGDPERAVHLEADRTVPYGQVVKVMAAASQAGVTKLGMVAEELKR